MELPEKLVADLCAYLAGKPWGEVNQLIVPLLQIRQASEQPRERPPARKNGKDEAEQNSNA